MWSQVEVGSDGILQYICQWALSGLPSFICPLHAGRHCTNTHLPPAPADQQNVRATLTGQPVSCQLPKGPKAAANRPAAFNLPIDSRRRWQMQDNLANMLRMREFSQCCNGIFELVCLVMQRRHAG